ncbi:hypothetical protein AOT96_29060 [Rhodococcus sp. 008]|nr:hypothetical protein AOT96_29060 [Rhodococcus sp. 008]
MRPWQTSSTSVPTLRCGCWAHFSNIDGPGYRALTVDETVDLGWEQTEQAGYAFRAILVKQHGAYGSRSCGR